MNTFVIRLWTPADRDPAAAADVHGIARHVASGRDGAFRDEAELLTLLRELPLGEDPVSDDYSDSIR